MAKAKRASQQKRVTIKADEAAPKSPEAVKREPTGKELVEEAKLRFEECFAKFETAVALLNHAGEAKYFEAYDQTQLETLRKLVANAGHNIPACRDAVTIMLGQHARADQTRPTIDVKIPQVTMAQIFVDKPSAEDIKEAAENLAFATALVADTDIKVHQSEQALRCLTFMAELHKNVKALGEIKAA